MDILRLPGNQENQQQMAAYMKHHFRFLGLAAPERKRASKGMIQASKKVPTTEVILSIREHYQLLEREYQYLAIDLALANSQRFSLPEVLELATLVSEKAWWDSVDAWRKFFGARIRSHPEELFPIFYYFYNSDDFWLRRVAINLQLMEKEMTNLELLSQAILNDRETAEFFIQKAIGWSLRQYSKTNPNWVKAFLNSHQLSPLAIREGSKQFK